jgi:hypothetical protein
MSLEKSNIIEILRINNNKINDENIKIKLKNNENFTQEEFLLSKKLVKYLVEKPAFMVKVLQPYKVKEELEKHSNFSENEINKVINSYIDNIDKKIKVGEKIKNIIKNSSSIEIEYN